MPEEIGTIQDEVQGQAPEAPVESQNDDQEWEEAQNEFLGKQPEDKTEEKKEEPNKPK